MVYSYHELIDAEGKIIEHQHPSCYPSGWVFKSFLIRNRIVTFSETLKRKEIFNKVGYLDERPEVTTCDDYDMWLKIAEVTQILYVPGNDVYYRMHDKNLVKNHDMNFNAHLFVYHRMIEEAHAIKSMPKGDLSRIVSRHLNGKYVDSPTYIIISREYNKARTLLRKSLILKPFVIKNWVYFLMCLLPPQLLDWLCYLKGQVLPVFLKRQN